MQVCHRFVCLFVCFYVICFDKKVTQEQCLHKYAQYINSKLATPQLVL